MGDIVQVKLVGGFGNQLHQYVAARKYAELVGAELEVPYWVGRTVFGLSERDWSCVLPEVNDGACGCPPELEWGRANVRLGGYFQTQRWINLLSRQEVRKWLQLAPRWEGVLRGSTRRRQPYTAAHLRQGDYLGHPLFATVTERAYLRACQRYGLTIDTWVRQDQPGRVEGLPDRLEFLPDFLTLRDAAILLRANSTFSWWAAVLGDGDVYAPVVEDHVGEYDADFVHGNWPRCADTRRVGVRIDDLRLPA